MKAEKRITVERVDKPRLKGRQHFIEMYKQTFPDFTDDLDDDTLYDFIDERYSDLDNRYSTLNGANERLAHLISENPRLGVFLSLISGEHPKSVPYALSSVFGREVFDMDEKDLEEYELGDAEYRRRYKESMEEQRKAQENFKQYEKLLKTYARDNELDDEQVAEIHHGVMNMAEDFLMGNIPQNIIDIVYKGLNYDQDVQEAIHTGVVEGKNQQITEKLRRKKSMPDVMPDLGNSSGSGRTATLQNRRKGSFYDAIEEVK